MTKKLQHWKAPGDALNIYIDKKIEADELVGRVELDLRQVQGKARVLLEDAVMTLREAAGVPAGTIVDHAGGRHFVESSEKKD